MTENQGHVAIVWEARAKDGRESEVRDLIARVVNPSRGDLGNIDYEVHEDEDRAGTFIVYERWTSRAMLERHTQSPWVPTVIPALQALLEEPIESTVRFLRPLRPAA